MSKKFTPITIGKHEHLEKEYNVNVETKKKRFKTLFDYLSTFIDTQDKNAFDGKIYDEFIQRFSDKHFANYPTLKIEKILDLHDCRSHQVEALINDFEAIKIDWDFESNTTKEQRDFTIKTEYPEQNERYLNTNKLIDALATLKSERHIYFADIVKGLNGIVAYDFSTQNIVPNLNYVLGIKERQTY